MSDTPLLMTEVSLRNVAQEISEITSIEELKNTLEARVGLDEIFALVSTGYSIEKISNTIGLPADKLIQVLCYNSELRLKFLQARGFKVAMDSLSVLDRNFSIATELDSDQQRAASHHRDIYKIGADLMSKASESNSAPIIRLVTEVARPVDEIPEEDIADAVLITEDDIEKLDETKD